MLLRNKNLKTNVKFSFRYDYGRKSGDANTSVGNTIINCGAYNYAMKIFGMNSSNTSEALMLGDDNLFGTDVDLDEEKIKQVFLEAGLVVKAKIHPSIYSSKFL